MSIERLLSRLFRHEEINGANRCPTYLHRWTLFQPRRPRALWRGFGVYLHKFVGDDWSRDLHDHPKRFVSIGLRGAYREVTPAPGGQPQGRWEVAIDHDGQMARVRWSQRDIDGRWYYCRHYPNDGWGLNACEGNAERLNRDGEVPWAMSASFQPAPATLTRVYRAPWARTFPATHIHRIELLDDRRPCWTLVVVLRSTREWGFWHGGLFIPWRDYVRGASSLIADKMKACP